MPGQPPPDGPDDRTVLYALPEDQPDSLSEGHTSNQADLDATPAEKAGGDDRPAQSDPKADWVAYAEARGVDVDGLTKDDIIAQF
jgi:hypothetical protein